MLCGGALTVRGRPRRRRSARLSIPEKITLLSSGAFIYLVLIGAIVGYTAYIWLLRHCDPAKVATYAYVNPVVAVLLGALFAGETLTGRTALAAAVIVGSVALVITAQQAKGKTTLSPSRSCAGEAIANRSLSGMAEEKSKTIADAAGELAGGT